MKTDVFPFFTRVALASAAGVALVVTGAAAAQQSSANPKPPASSETRPEAKAAAQEKIEAARDTKQDARSGVRDAREGSRDTAREGRQETRNTREGARDTAQGAREGARDAARDDRQTTRDTREGARDAARDGRQTVREARRETRSARREFLASRIRSGDLGLWVRRAANGLMVSDVANRGAIAQTGLKEGDEIISVGGQPVMSERQFIDLLFTDHESNKPVQVVVKRNGQQQTISLQPKLFVAEHMADDNRLHEYGLILDDSNPSQVKVQAVVPRSPAFYAGVRSGDQITGVGGQQITALADFIRSLASAAGNTTSVEINRNNQKRQLEIDIPDENVADEPRTALRPTLPDASTVPPARPVPQPKQ